VTTAGGGSAVAREKGPVIRAEAGLLVTGLRGFSGRGGDVTAASRVDSHEIRGLCFLYPHRS